ncbi:MAG: 30S ribosomal protein S12 methylthiotransferase RimO [Eubacteriales bacterium]|nr:30S ribosomal protein S12 methylthiotransferase RimO [Eubacteriales bacterium]
MKIGMISLGCAKNRVDSENLLGRLKAAGHEFVDDPAQADAIFVNTCGFIEDAKQESIDAILEMAAARKKGAKLLVTGCLAQRYSDALMEEIPEIDGLLGVKDYDKALSLLGSDTRASYTDGTERFPDGERILTTPPYSAFVKISDGCDNRCSYCAIPLIRGRYLSRPYEEIVDECERLAEGGVTEITLIAQDTSRYGNDIYGKTRMSELLQRVAAIEKVKWVRVLYCYPDTADDELLETIAHTPKVCAYLDLPLQHINDRLLKKMNRRGSSEWIKSRIEKCRQLGITLRTTMIVGFPGETEEEFQELMDFVRWARFDRLGAFAYSPEEDTPAAAMPGQIDQETKYRRLDQLMMLQQEISMEINESRVGEECTVLCEGWEDGLYYGRSPKEAPESDGNIRFTAQREIQPGEYVKVKILSAEAYDLYGEEMQ